MFSLPTVHALISHRYLEHQKNKTNEAAEISNKLSEKKKSIVNEITVLTKQIQDTETETRKIEDSLQNYVGRLHQLIL